MQSSEKPSEPVIVQKIFKKIDPVLEYMNNKRVSINTIIDTFIDTHPQFCDRIGSVISRVKSKLLNTKTSK